MKSPAERPVITEPLALHLEHLLYYIAGTAVTAITPADIDTCLLYLSTRIGRTTGASATAHHLEVGDIVAHEYQFVVGIAITLLKSLVCLHLHSTFHEDVLHSKTLIAQSYSIGVSACHDGYA